MGTIRDLVTGSLRLIEEVGAGETATAESCADGLTALNAMIGTWSIQGDLVYTEVTENFTLTASTALRTIGPTGNFVTTRPVRVVAVSLNYATNIQYDVKVIGAAEYAAIPDKTLSGIPQYVYYDGNYPNAGMYFYPVPDSNYPITIYSQKPLSDFSTISDTLVAPPGYERAFRFNLAAEIAPEYGKQASVTVMKVAIESKNAIRDQNALNDTDVLRVDDALLEQNIFNIYRGY